MGNQFIFSTDLIQTGIDAKTKEEAIKELSKLFEVKGYTNSEYYKLVIEREKDYPTGLVTQGAVIAMPHAFDSNVRGTHVAVGVLKKSVNFYNMENVDEEIPVEVIFMLAVGEADKQLETLKILMSIFKDKGLLKKIKKMDSNGQIAETLNEYILGGCL